MLAAELQAKVIAGKIEIPQPYRDQFQGEVNVILFAAGAALPTLQAKRRTRHPFVRARWQGVAGCGRGPWRGEVLHSCSSAQLQDKARTTVMAREQPDPMPCSLHSCTLLCPPSPTCLPAPWRRATTRFCLPTCGRQSPSHHSQSCSPSSGWPRQRVS
jgi:hypothetical protein